MAFKLSRDESLRRDELVNELRAKLEEFNTARTKEEPDPKEVQDTASLLSVIIDEAEDFRSSIVDRLREEFDEKSEKWHESDKASEADEFINEWENAEFSSDLEGMLDPDYEMDDFADTLESLPEEMG